MSTANGKRVQWRTVVGVLLTFVYLCLAAYLSRGMWSSLTQLNEVGDFLAGIVGPIALLWLILSYLQQGSELRAQADEIKRSVQEQAALVEVTRQQHKAALAAFEREGEFKRMSLTPKLGVFGTWAGTNAETLTRDYRFTIHNGGYPAALVELAFPGRGVSAAPSVIDQVIAGAPRDFFIRDLAAGTRLPAILEMRYVDGLENPCVRHFEITSEGDYPERITLRPVEPLESELVEM